MPDLDLGALQTQLELNRSILADSIMSKFSSLGAAAAATSSSSSSSPSKKGAANSSSSAVPAAPRSATLGVGATPKAHASANGKASSIEDVKLKGRLLAKRKHSDHAPSHVNPNDAQVDDEEDEQGRAAAVASLLSKRASATDASGAASKKKKKITNDPFAVQGPALQQQLQQLQAAREKVVIDDKEVELSSLSKAQRKKFNKRRRLEQQEQEQEQAEAVEGDAGVQQESNTTKACSKATPFSPANVEANAPVPTASATSSSSAPTAQLATPPAAAPALTALQSQMLERLTGSRFRTINEQLYTTDSRSALSSFTADPSIFDEYHQGFRSQVKSWPKNPLDMLASLLLSAKKGKAGGGSARSGKATKSAHTGEVKARFGACPFVIDLGAGEGALAQKLVREGEYKVLSYDLVNTVDGWVRQADTASIGAIPLPGYYSSTDPLSLLAPPPHSAQGQADIAIFCLSLMGTNWPSMILEAKRCLRIGAELLIAEVSSRFTNVDFFVTLVEKMGFKMEKMDQNNSHFIVFEFVKVKRSEEVATQGESESWTEDKLVQVGGKLLKPCLYKRR